MCTQPKGEKKEACISTIQIEIRKPLLGSWWRRFMFSRAGSLSPFTQHKIDLRGAHRSALLLSATRSNQGHATHPHTHPLHPTHTPPCGGGGRGLFCGLRPHPPRPLPLPLPQRDALSLSLSLLCFVEGVRRGHTGRGRARANTHTGLVQTSRRPSPPPAPCTTCPRLSSWTYHFHLQLPRN